MRVEAIQLRQFRNYDTLNLTDFAGCNIILGENAAGKTNLLEVLYYLSRGKSPRTHHDKELIQWQQPFATVKVMAESQALEMPLTLEAQWVLNEAHTLKTVFKLNGNLVKNRSEMVGKLPTVTFFLSDLLLLRGSPDDRRTAIDSALVQFDPTHFRRLHHYNRLRQQKGHALKQAYYDADLLAALNEQLALAGAEVMYGRLTYLQILEHLLALRYHELSQGREPLSISYQASTHAPLPEEVQIPELQTLLAEAIAQRSLEERQRAQVLVGPHRDDIRFYLDGQDACAYGSQGQQRSIVLALKLAELDVLEHRLDGESPILLLDDVMAELDPARQQQLLTYFKPGMQVFLTTTHLDPRLEGLLADRSVARIYTVRNGTVIPERALVMGETAHAF